MLKLIKNIFNAIILALAVVGFLSLGGGELVQKLIDKYYHPSQESKIEKAQRIGDFSKIGEEFEIDKTASAFGYSGVLAEHKATGQKLLVIDSGKKVLVTQEDIQSPDIDEKIQNLTKKFKYNAISVENVTVTQRGMLVSYGKNVPFVKFDAKIRKLPIDEISGILAVVEVAPNESRTLVALNEKKKYSQLISAEFFKNIKNSIKN